MILFFVELMLQAKTRHGHVKEAKNHEKWVDSDDLKEPPSPPPMHRPTPKPVDEDLYKISPELLYAKHKKVYFRLVQISLSLP